MRVRAAGAMLVERVPMHYAPTASLAVGDRRAFRPTRHTGIVANELAAAEAKGQGAEGLSLTPLEDAVKGPVRLVPPLAQPGYLFAPLLDQLVVLDDVEVNRNDPYGWSPLPKSRGKNARFARGVDGVAVRRAGADGGDRFADGGGDGAEGVRGAETRRRRRRGARFSIRCVR